MVFECKVDADWLRTQHPFAYYATDALETLQEAVCSQAKAGYCHNVEWPPQTGKKGLCKWTEK